MSNALNRGFLWLFLALAACTQAATAADRTPTKTTTKAPVKAAPTASKSTRTPSQTAQQLRIAKTSSTQALKTMIQTHRISLRSADFYLANAKYSAVERATAVRNTYSANQSAASLLRSQITAQDAYLQLRCWHYPPQDAATAVVGVYPEASTEEVAEGMAAEGASADDIAAFLKNAGYTAEQIANFLEQNLGMAVEAVLAVLVRVIGLDGVGENITYTIDRIRPVFGNSVTNAGNWLVSTLGYTWEQAAEILLRAGYSAKKIATWLKDTIGASASSVTKFLKNVAGLTAKKTVELLRKIGFSFSEIWDAVKGRFGSSTKKLVGWLKTEGATARQVSSILIDKIGSTASQVFDRLLEAGYRMEDVLDVLANVFEWEKQQILALLIAKNQATDAVLQMLNSMFTTQLNLMQEMAQ